ncbi:MAG: aryl-sulfate sulfotransferase [Candidatus Hodarchaeota archaeon]
MRAGIQFRHSIVSVILIFIVFFALFGFEERTLAIPDTSDSEVFINTWDPSKTYNGTTIFSPYMNKALIETDMDGNVLWVYQLKDHGITGDNLEGIQDIEPLEDGTFLLAVRGYGLLKIDHQGRTLWEYQDIQAHHDVDLLDNGHILYLSSAFDNKSVINVSLEYDLVIELNPNTGEVVWQWNASEYFDPLVDFFPLDERHDWTHANEIHRYSTGETLISFRNLDRIIKVNQDGEIIWTFGRGSSLGNGTLHHAHGPEILPTGNFLIFDNGLYYSNESRVIEINPSTGEIVWEYNIIFNFQGGNTQLLPNGNIFICEARGGKIIEVTREKELVWEMYYDLMLIQELYGPPFLLFKAKRLKYSVEETTSVPGFEMGLFISLVVIVISNATFSRSKRDRGLEAPVPKKSQGSKGGIIFNVFSSMS